MDSVNLDYIIKILSEGNAWTFLLGAGVYSFYKKREDIYKLFYGIIQKKLLITNEELLNHIFFVHIKHNLLNNSFNIPKENCDKAEFKYYVANALNYITQGCYFTCFLCLVEDYIKNKSDIDELLPLTLNKTELLIEKNIKTYFSDDLYDIYKENTYEIREFYHSLIISILDYDQFELNQKIYTILNTLLFITKTNQNSLFSKILSMNGRLEILQKDFKYVNKIKLITDNVCKS